VTHLLRHRRPKVEQLEDRRLPSAGTWTQLTNPDPSSNGASTMILLTNGTVMVQGGGNPISSAANWELLTPSSTGSYINGTWSSIASMHLGRLYYASNVLPNGNVFVMGGEYTGNGTTQNFSNKGEIYNPVTNTWTPTANFPQSQFGDDPSQLLSNGNVLLGYLGGPQTYIYNPTTNTYTQTGTKLNNDQSDEETWVKLANGDILSYNVFGSNGGNNTAQFYNQATGTWTQTGNVPVTLQSSNFELGPGFLLQNGNVFQIGATGATAIYNPTTNSWTAGPTIPNHKVADDAPGAMLPNGNVLFTADTYSFSGPTKVFMYNPSTNKITSVPVPSALSSQLSSFAFADRMLVLPTGQVLLTTGSNTLWVFTPGGTVKSSVQPVVQSVVNNNNGTYTLTGTGLNGVSEGAVYGDDAEMSSNYPIVYLTNSTGQVFYATTTNWSLPGAVQTGSTTETVNFTLPAGLAPGSYSLFVSGAGISSATGFSFTVPGVGSAAPGVASFAAAATGTGTSTTTVVHGNSGATPSVIGQSPASVGGSGNPIGQVATSFTVAAATGPGGGGQVIAASSSTGLTGPSAVTIAASTAAQAGTPGTTAGASATAVVVSPTGSAPGSTAIPAAPGFGSTRIVGPEDAGTDDASWMGEALLDPGWRQALDIEFEVRADFDGPAVQELAPLALGMRTDAAWWLDQGAAIAGMALGLAGVWSRPAAEEEPRRRSHV